jgi:hypothetical protein
MTLKKPLLIALTAVTLMGSANVASAQRHDRDHDGRRDNSYAERHDRDGYRDRYYRKEYRSGYVSRDRVYGSLRERGYSRWDGDPYWRDGYYVVRSYDRRGRGVYVEVNPYTGAYIRVRKF